MRCQKKYKWGNHGTFFHGMVALSENAHRLISTSFTSRRAATVPLVFS